MAARSLRPDCSTINLAETSDQPKDWLLHPTGITFEFDAKLKTLKRNNPFAYPTEINVHKNWKRGLPLLSDYFQT